MESMVLGVHQLVDHLELVVQHRHLVCLELLVQVYLLLVVEEDLDPLAASER